MKHTQRKNKQFSKGFNEWCHVALIRMADELFDTERRRSCKGCKGLTQLHLLSVTTVPLTAACAASLPQEKPCFHSQSTPTSSSSSSSSCTSSFPSNPSLPLPLSLSLSSSCFPSNKHTGSVHYYSPGFTKTRIIALLPTTVSGEAGRQEGREKERKGKARDILW